LRLILSGFFDENMHTRHEDKQYFVRIGDFSS